MTRDRMPGSGAAWLAVLVAIGAGLRVYRLDTPLWFDEILTLLESVRLPLGAILTQFPGDNHHALYSVLGHLSVAAFGEHPWSLRLPSALFGVATIPLLYLAGTAVTSRLEAGAAAVMLTVSYHHVWFSQNARGYTAVLFFVLLSTWALVRWLDTGRRPLLLLYAVATALGAYAHLTMVLVSIGQALAVAAGWLPGRDAARVRTGWPSVALGFAAAGVLTAAMYAPMLADVASSMATAEASTGRAVPLWWTVLAAIQGLEVGFGALWGIAIGALVFLIGGLSYLRQRPTVALLFALPVVLTVGTAIVLGRPVRPRFMFFAMGFALLVSIRGAAVTGEVLARRLWPRAAPVKAALVTVALLTAGFVALSLRSLPYGYRVPKQDYEQAVRLVERTARAGGVAAVVGDAGAVPVMRYLGRDWARIDSEADLRHLRAEAAEVWVVYTFASYIENGAPDLWATLQQCPEMGAIDSTVADGSISIRRCP